MLPVRAAAFGHAFGLIMERRWASANRIDEPAPVDATLDADLERLIGEHDIEPALADYVRHVLRYGFDSAFDSMDPTSTP